MVQPYMDDDDYFGQVLNGCKTNDGLFAVPLFFEPNMIYCRNDLIDTVSDIHQFTACLINHPDETGLVPYNYPNYLKELYIPHLYTLYQNDLYKDGSITLDSITGFLTSAKIIYDRMLEKPDTENDPSIGPVNTLTQDIYGITCHQSGSVSLYPCQSSFDLTSFANAFLNEGYTFRSTGSCLPEVILGIHSKSKHQSESIDFLNFLIEYPGTAGPDREIPFLGNGIPVYKDGIRLIQSWNQSRYDRMGFDKLSLY